MHMLITHSCPRQFHIVVPPALLHSWSEHYAAPIVQSLAQILPRLDSHRISVVQIQRCQCLCHSLFIQSLADSGIMSLGIRNEFKDLPFSIHCCLSSAVRIISLQRRCGNKDPRIAKLIIKPPRHVQGQLTFGRRSPELVQNRIRLQNTLI